jgi:hypothetical protein
VSNWRPEGWDWLGVVVVGMLATAGVAGVVMSVGGVIREENRAAASPSPTPAWTPRDPDFKPTGETDPDLLPIGAPVDPELLTIVGEAIAPFVVPPEDEETDEGV